MFCSIAHRRFTTSPYTTWVLVSASASVPAAGAATASRILTEEGLLRKIFNLIFLGHGLIHSNPRGTRVSSSYVLSSNRGISLLCTYLNELILLDFRSRHGRCHLFLQKVSALTDADRLNSYTGRATTTSSSP